MATPLFFSPPRLVERVDARAARSLRELLAVAGAPCRASGRWTERRVRIVPGAAGVIEKEPGDWSPVRIGVPAGLSARDAARYAVAAMAYGLMDLVARESIRGQPWARPAPPRGRPATGTAMSNRERQRTYRARRRAEGNAGRHPRGRDDQRPQPA
jgi:hypothetical protein